jgi:hypothetical protein
MASGWVSLNCAAQGVDDRIEVKRVPQGFHLALIGLVIDGNRVRFEVNAEAVRRAGLALSSQVLKLARVVKGGAPEPERR